MNTKRWIVASVIVFVVYEVLSFIIHNLILSGAYQATSELWRSMEEMNRLTWIMWLGGLIWSFIFVYVFAKGYEARGIAEGVRYGLLIGLFFSIPMSFNTYASMPFTIGLAAGWLVFGIVQILICGIVASLIYKAKPQIES